MNFALDSCAQFLAVLEHRLIPSKARSICHQLRRAGHHSVWAPACQDGILSLGGHACQELGLLVVMRELGFLVLVVLPYLSHPLSLLSFRSFSGWVGS